jgi:hypothetical protein
MGAAVTRRAAPDAPVERRTVEWGPEGPPSTHLEAAARDARYRLLNGSACRRTLCCLGSPTGR